MDEQHTKKVTAIVTCANNLLLIKHPYAGFELPAGTVEPDEEPLAAAVREIEEETSIIDIRLIKELGVMNLKLPEGMASLLTTATIYSRPDESSFGWATIKRSAWVNVLRKTDGWMNINYSEPDCLPKKNYDTYSLTGWVQEENLAFAQKRHFYHFVSNNMRVDKWHVFTDCHRFEVGWYNMDSLPGLTPPQDEWLIFGLEKMDRTKK